MRLEKIKQLRKYTSVLDLINILQQSHWQMQEHIAFFSLLGLEKRQQQKITIKRTNMNTIISILSNFNKQKRRMVGKRNIYYAQ